MQIWLQKGDKKSGPHLDYEVRAMLREGEINKDNLAWHEGLENWSPLCELELFASETDPEPLPEPAPQPPSLPAQGTHLARRLGARWFDFFLYSFLLALLIHITGHNLLLLRIPLWPFILLCLPWPMLEAASLHLWGTTPGKYLMGLSLRSKASQPIAISTALVRSLRVFALGFGFTVDLLILLGHLFNLYCVKKTGLAVWDARSELEIHATPPQAAKILTFIGLLALFLGGLMVIYNLHFLNAPASALPPELLKIQERMIELYRNPPQKT